MPFIRVDFKYFLSSSFSMFVYRAILSPIASTLYNHKGLETMKLLPYCILL